MNRRRHLLPFASPRAVPMGAVLDAAPAHGRPLRALVRLALAVGLFAFAGGAACLDDEGSAEERIACEETCAAEAECGIRSEADCLASLCAEDGFVDVDAVDGSFDLATDGVHDCVKAATDCAALLLCSCPATCERLSSCGLEPGEDCETDCAALIEQEPEAAYLEARCRLETDCIDVATCSQVGG